MSETDPSVEGSEASVDAAGEDLAGGSYEVIRSRLVNQAAELGRRTDALNQARQEAFGGSELAVIGNERVRTANNCVPRDIVQIGGRLLFAYNVFIGLRPETTVADVLALHTFDERGAESEEGEGFDLSEVPQDDRTRAFLQDRKFLSEFSEVYKFYKEAKLVKLSRTESKLLAVFQIGLELEDVRAFRWSIDVDGNPTYIDNRGERDHEFPPQHDFEWTLTSRDDHRGGKHPHVSILDKLFVETVGGDLTVKVEDNTASGQGIYAEPVEDPRQSLDDAEFHFAELGTLIVLKILPFREDDYRYLVFATRSNRVVRIDAMGEACVQLPEDHGIIFPGGYFLQDGQYKVFDGDFEDYEFERMVRSPNGEDVLYVFHHREGGGYALFPYNLIRKEVQNPILAHGYSLFDDGRMVVFRLHSEDPTRVHGMQVWQTPFVSAEHADQQPNKGGALGKIGNAELVRGISEAYSIKRAIDETEPSRQIYEDLIAAIVRVLDAYHWLKLPVVGNLQETLSGIRDTAELVVDEFDKVQAIKARAVEAVNEAASEQEVFIRTLRPDIWTEIEEYMTALTGLRTKRGHLISLKEVRYADVGHLDAMEVELVENFDRISGATIEFLQGDAALTPLATSLEALLQEVDSTDKSSELKLLAKRVEDTGEGLEVLSQIVGGLEVDDPTIRTEILERISEVFGQLNRTRATVEARRRSLLSNEGRAEFAAQFKLFSQSVSSALGLATTPDKADEQLSRLMVQLEELEGRFSEFDEFIAELATRREEVYEALSQRKQELLDERARKAQNLFRAAERILQGVERRGKGFKNQDELNAYFASDPMLLKLRELRERLVELGDGTKADEVESRLKTARQSALRGLRDRTELFEGGENLIKFGQHRFTTNTQALELTMLPDGEGGMQLSLAGTDYRDDIMDAEFAKTQRYWDQQIPSENKLVYRGEYLAASLFFGAEDQSNGHSLQSLQEARHTPDALLPLIRKVAAERYDEGYERGLHDADAALILERLLTMRESVGLLRYAPTARGLALTFWTVWGRDDGAQEALRESWHRRAQSFGRVRAAFGHAPALAELGDELGAAISEFSESVLQTKRDPALSRRAGRYLAEELTRERPQFVLAKAAEALRDEFLRGLEELGARAPFQADLDALTARTPERLEMIRSWLGRYIDSLPEEDGKRAEASSAFEECVVLIATERELDRETNAGRTKVEIPGLLGQHANIKDQTLTLRFDEFLARLRHFCEVEVPGFRAFRQIRQETLVRERERLRVDEFMPRVLSSFVRNKLINDAYLPLIGANLAKQLGAAGAKKRTDLMGLLLLISPPGYGKTTLMEYIANRLGLVFMKVNGPALGHSVHSLDPTEAPNATARQEVEKINLALEMGNNVMLYLDDIQHTHPELLQKFISLCDAQRRIEGVWNGKTRTYDLRGKRFCVIMAGNPYTESGEKFQIPDMLSNRADTYNLGDVLGGQEEAFSLSYIENSITSNEVLAPLAARSQQDIYRLIKMARGEDIPTSELEHNYAAVEINEIKAVFQRLFKCQETLLAVNLEYIRSASMDDAFRTEPPFKLQGSYRNMNKLAEKIVAAMNGDELDRLIEDHYIGEAQTLTSGAENAMLKLRELRGTLTPEQAARWDSIKKEFKRRVLVGGADDDPVARVTGTLSSLGGQLESIRDALRSALETSGERELASAKLQAEQLAAQLEMQRESLSAQREAVEAQRASAEASQASVEAQRRAAEAQRISAEASQESLEERRKQTIVQQRTVEHQLAVAPPTAPGATAVDAPYHPPPEATADPAWLRQHIERLDQVLEQLSNPQINLEVTNKAPPGVEELLAQQVAIIERTLVPLVRTATTKLDDREALMGKLDELLTRLGLLERMVTNRS
jgi:hypothetical protein